jgi:NADPH:quinone reductase-like Zn-dependent oxidoreductase
MKAAVCTRYGPPEVVRIAEVAKPVPRDNEILVKVIAATVARGDVRIRSFTVPFWQWLPARLYLGVRKPKRAILGMELAGEIEALGKDVTRFKKGDHVFSFVGFGFGAHAEYKCLPEDGARVEEGLVAPMPATMTFAEAAAATGGALTALRYMRNGRICPGQKVLIYGASGCVGTFAVQLARHFGADVTGVCSAANLELVKSLGAGRAIDYAASDFAASGVKYDFIFDAVAKLPRRRARRALKKGGIFLSSHDNHGPAVIKAEDLVFLKSLIEAGKIKSVIDRTYPLERIVEAHRYVDMGHKKGNVVITVGQNNKTAWKWSKPENIVDNKIQK